MVDQNDALRLPIERDDGDRGAVVLHRGVDADPYRQVPILQHWRGVRIDARVPRVEVDECRLAADEPVLDHSQILIRPQRTAHLCKPFFILPRRDRLVAASTGILKTPVVHGIPGIPSSAGSYKAAYNSTSGSAGCPSPSRASKAKAQQGSPPPGPIGLSEGFGLVFNFGVDQARSTPSLCRRGGAGEKTCPAPPPCSWMAPRQRSATREQQVILPALHPIWSGRSA